LAAADWVILPGSKHTTGDLQWLRQQGLDRAICDHAARGGAVLGICGGLQMLGEALVDLHGIDGNAPGLGLLPLVTVFDPDKTVRRTQSQFLPDLKASGPWASLAGVPVAGYEIHHGQTQQQQAMALADDWAVPVLPDNLGWRNAAGNVLGLYLHGMFEDAAVLAALFGAQATTPEQVFDGLADYIDQHFAPGVLAGLIGQVVHTPVGGSALFRMRLEAGPKPTPCHRCNCQPKHNNDDCAKFAAGLGALSLHPGVGLVAAFGQHVRRQESDGQPDEAWQQQHIVEIPQYGNEVWNQVDGA
jgi:hypothetical protein